MVIVIARRVTVVITRARFVSAVAAHSVDIRESNSKDEGKENKGYQPFEGLGRFAHVQSHFFITSWATCDMAQYLLEQSPCPLPNLRLVSR